MSRVDENAELGRVIAEGAESGLMSDKLAELLYIQDIGKSLAVIADHIQPTRPTGHWILKRTFPTKMYDEYLNEYECSECHRGIRCTDAQLVNYPYCHCGARMTESEE